MARPRIPDDVSLDLFERATPVERDADAVPAAMVVGEARQSRGEPAIADPRVSRILDGLNDEQRAAVTHGKGPALIVAGAGTGKTEVITRRIAWLIATKAARPDQILALTFTEKAAAEMEARVDELVPYGYTDTTICTFHAFGDQLLRQHAIELGLTTRLRVETEAEMLVFLREHLFELGLSHYLPLGRPDEHLRALLKLFDSAGDEDVTPERYLAFAADLAARATTDDARDRAALELEKAGAYAAYQRLIMEHGRIDFGAQIGLALRLLRERAYVRREIQDRYHYILVDEFQDTNHVQFELLKLLAGARHNVAVVGDDDQSIYRFRGAKVENLLGFLDAFPGAEIRVLRRNYRSGQRILDAAHRMIRNNDPDRLESARDIDKRLVAERGLGAEIEHREFVTMSDEADGVAAEIHDHITSGSHPPGAFAILARSHTHLEPFAAALKAHGVPFRRTNTRGLYARPEVQLCLNVLRSVADPADSLAAFHALGDPLFEIDAVDLQRLAARARRSNRALLAVAERNAADAESELAPPSRAGITRFAALHRQLSTSAVTRTTTEVLYEFAAASGLLSQLHDPDRAEAVEQAQNLNKLLHIAQRIGPLLAKDRVSQFIGHLDLLIEAGDDPSAVEVEIDENAVHLLTAHNAKGLEFPVVYLVQLVEGRFPVQRRSETLELPHELRLGGSDERRQHELEERRLFYVAMTRARDRLVLTHAADYGGKTARKRSRFVTEALDLAAVKGRPAAPSPLTAIERFAPGAEPVPTMRPPLSPDAPLVLSHKQVDDFLTCPLKYWYAHVAGIPLQSNPLFMFGHAVHHAIQVFHQERLRGHPIDVDVVLAAFADAWSSEGFISREHEERRLEEGRAILRRFVAEELASRSLPLAVETGFDFRLDDHTTVIGRIDRIDEHAGSIVLVDYKTSDIEEAALAEKRAQQSLEGDQLGLYVLGYHEKFGVMPVRAELRFVASGAVGSAVVAPHHLEAARTRLAQAARGIRASQFPARPESKRCAFCPYSRFCPSSATRGGPS